MNKDLLPIIELSKMFISVEAFKKALNSACKLSRGFSYSVNGVSISIKNELALMEWAKKEGFKTESEAFRALQQL